MYGLLTNSVTGQMVVAVLVFLLALSIIATLVYRDYKQSQEDEKEWEEVVRRVKGEEAENGADAN